MMENLKRWWRSGGYGKPLEEEPMDKSLEVTIPPNPGVTVEVVKNAPPMVMMYKAGSGVHVELPDIPKMQADGWVFYDSDEIRAMGREVSEFLSLLPTQIMQFVDKVLEDGIIDAQEEMELHVMTRTWKEAQDRLQHLINVVSQMYPVREG